MVKIRLRRMGNKHRPYYRIVVAKSVAGRDGAFVEIIGTSDPLARPKKLEVKEDRALHWLMNGAQPTETVAHLLKQAGVLDKFFEARPNAKAKFKSLDKRTAAISVKSAVGPAQVDAPASKPKAEKPAEAEAKVESAPAEEPAAETPVTETPAEEVAAE